MKPFDASGAFRPTADSIRRLAVRGAGVTVFSSGLAVVVQIISTVILARLLTPADFGVVTMVTTFSLLLVNFGQNGFTEAVIQWQTLDHALASNLFWINSGGSLLLTVGFAAAGSTLARFYHDPRVARVAVGISLSIFLSSLSVLHAALLKRAMRFSAAAANTIVAQTTSIAVAILLAWAGWGYWALVAATIAQAVSATIGFWILCPWVPGLPKRVKGTGGMVRFAMNVYGRFSVNYFSRNTDNLLVGWRFEAQALGFYKKAYDLFALSAGQLVSPLSNVAVSALSRLDQKSIQYRRHLLSALAIMAFVGMGVGGDLTLIGKDVIRLLLGPAWGEAGRIFTLFGPGIGVMMLYNAHGWIHLSIGRADRWFRWGFIEYAFTALLFVLALRWGPMGIAGAWTLSSWILIVPAFWYAGRPIQLGVAPMVAATWKFPFAGLLAGGASFLALPRIGTIVASTGPAGAFIRCVVISLLFGTLYLCAVTLLYGGFAPIYQLGRLLREMNPLGAFSKRTPGVPKTYDANAGEALP